jgi:nucleotide-binding universal stress UspA family protein
MHSGPVIIGFDGTPASERALREAAALLAPRRALVVTIWEAGRGFEVVELPIRAIEAPPVEVDVRTALELEETFYEAAQRLAEQGAALAREAGLDAEGLAVADDITVPETLIRLVRELDAPAVVVGTHGHRDLRELLLGSTSRELVKKAPVPVIVVREQPARH